MQEMARREEMHAEEDALTKAPEIGATSCEILPSHPETTSRKEYLQLLFTRLREAKINQ